MIFGLFDSGRNDQTAISIDDEFDDLPELDDIDFDDDPDDDGGFDDDDVLDIEFEEID